MSRCGILQQNRNYKELSGNARNENTMSKNYFNRLNK